MKRIFADACYWIALIHRNDELCAAADAAKEQLADAILVTTDEVLVEFLNFINAKAPHLRATAAHVVEKLRSDPNVCIHEQSRSSFDEGLGRYKKFHDKEWSMVDCVSFELMAREGMREALTNDHHFEQAGFVRLMT